MNFFNNKIVNPTGSGPTFDEWLNKFLTKEASEEEKTASEAAPEQDGDCRGQGRGQVINNDNEDGANSYQTGESVDGKSAQGGNARKDAGGMTDQNDNTQSDKEGASDEKTVEACEMGEADDAGKVTEEHVKAAPTDGTDCEQLINNDPNYQKGESTNPGKSESDSKKDAKSKSGFKKVTGLTRKEKLQLFAKLSASKTNPIQYVESMVGLKFANMTDEEKAWFKSFWEILYPADYAAEMAADR